MESDLNNFLRNNRLEEVKIKFFAYQIFRALKYLHSAKIMHRDLKPANILVHNNTFKICDFGFSKYVDDVQNVLKSCVGSPIYMAPQIL